MALHLYDQFDIRVSQSTVSRALAQLDITRKTMQRTAAQRSVELRNHWLARLTGWKAEQLVFVDESAANEKTADRKYGWSAVRHRATEQQYLKRSARWSILPAYSLDGYIAYTIRHGSIKGPLFNDFIRDQVRPLCSPFPGPRSVLIMDNASIHHSQASLTML